MVMTQVHYPLSLRNVDPSPPEPIWRSPRRKAGTSRASSISTWRTWHISQATSISATSGGASYRFGALKVSVDVLHGCKLCKNAYF